MPNDTATVTKSAAEPLAMQLRKPVLAHLAEFGVIEVSGADAVSFLQSQLTNDVAGLAPDRMELGGYCTVKGRLLATFHVWRSADAVLMRLPRELIASVIKRLSMYVLRSKAKLEDVSDAWSTWALIGAGSADRLRGAGFAPPDAPWRSSLAGKLRIDRVLPAPDIAERFLLALRDGAELPAGIAALPRVSSAVWWSSEVAAAVPTVFAATQEKFVPQMINFEVLGGVNFRKGCYPGQEIVARSQYLGKLRRRMHVAHADAADVQPGADIYSSDGQAVGTVVMAAAADGGTDLLFEVPVERLGSGSLHLVSGSGPKLDVRPLPYELFDPTA
jgi:folate-binding protein YgfZ